MATMLSLPIAQPKPQSQPRRRSNLHRRLMLAFVNAVWARESDEHGWAHCHYCRHIVKRGSEFFGAEAHHLLKRSTHPERKYDPAAGVLACIDCHRKQHA